MDQEQISIDDKALYLIARAADGSMRDGLSLLDQGIALGLKDIHHSKVTGDFIEKMLGFSNQDHLFDVWDLIFDAQTTQLITKVQTLIDQGADALLLMQDLLDTLYWIIILKQSPQLCHDLSWPEVQRDRGSSLSHKLSMGVLLMMWQMMTNGYEEITKSPNPLQAIQIVLMRLCYLKTLTPIENLILYEQQNISNSNNINIDTKPSITSSLNNNDPIEIRNFQDLVQLLEDHKEMLMMEELKMCAQACEINSYTIKIGTQRDSFKDSYRTLEKKINQITKKNWKIIITTNKNEINSMPVVEDIKKTMKNKALEHPVIKKMLDNLPKGTTISV
jgi:DNA polymerase-3 subunit gamma/tau